MVKHSTVLEGTDFDMGAHANGLPPRQSEYDGLLISVDRLEAYYIQYLDRPSLLREPRGPRDL